NGLNVQAAAPLVSSLLGGALNAQSNGQISRVLVEDASGHTGNASQAIRGAAQARLSNGGYTFIDASTAAHRATSAGEVGSGWAPELAIAAPQAPADQAGDATVAYDVSDVVVITGAVVLASAPHDRQVRAIVDAIEEQLLELGAKPASREGQREGRWVLLDYV